MALSKKGLIPIVSNEMPFNIGTNSTDTFLLRYSTPIGMMLGQGDKYFTGLYGPFPVQNDNEFFAYTYSFFIPDKDIGTPRSDLNIYVFALLFIPKFYYVNSKSLSKKLDEYISNYKDVGDISRKSNFSELLKNISMHLGISTYEAQVPIALEISNRGMIKPDTQTQKKSPEFIPLEIDGESLVAVPWILHAVYHGLEKATYDLLGESTIIHEELMEQYTVEILNRFHLLDSLIGENKTVIDALKLGIEHLERVGEKVKLKVLSENKYELAINCDFADAVHPHLPLSKCLWMRYLTSIVRRVLPPNTDIILGNSEFDQSGSVTIMEIKKRPFKSITSE